ncbi:tRNA (adenosine(37)-N6)-threonylcarbamoyltransferase complex dimerization subunit type 1 TsaB [Marivita hallyeonensis]|uniref:tRNA threonylcarbamoyl adenosine modification protein YeaZ n=1 Tax=Marivita hallyeonensis TaxID=996342 RepID=A0A1M5M011_9RHOB|nr:tRNA (adenosine(37)-N6)-threonylcarbamoyltransferase complex dimerization subunit type 1 TsaB [Marivita hallyeonensis]SHG70611.1 tRNA threonylcarbamoyl adenosine modification protein YeaZ [Marivita hallyeonensis]
MILAFDTSGPACLAALRDPDGTTVTRIDEMARGQAEHLMPMLEGLLSRNSATWSDLTRIGVGVGPGNFTGIRIAVSAARGLALGLGVPAIGVSTLDAIHHLYPTAVAAVPAPRDMLYLQPAGEAPRLGREEDAHSPVFLSDRQKLIAAIAECAAIADPKTAGRPKPLYIKPADAAPSRDTGPVMLT